MKCKGASSAGANPAEVANSTTHGAVCTGSIRWMRPDRFNSPVILRPVRDRTLRTSFTARSNGSPIRYVAIALAGSIDSCRCD